MNSKKVFFLSTLLMLSGLFITSCGDSDPECSEAAFSQDIDRETSAIIDALTSFTLDPTNPDVCNDYKDALDSYIDALENYRSCAEELGQLNDFNEGLNEARQSLDDTVCP